MHCTVAELVSLAQEITHDVDALVCSKVTSELELVEEELDRMSRRADEVRNKLKGVIAMCKSCNTTVAV